MRYLLFVVKLAVLGGLGFALVVLAGVAGSSLHWSFDLAAQFLLPAVVVAGAATLAAAACRWPRIAGGGLATAVAAYLVAAPFTSAPSPVAKDAARFKVLLFNVWHANWRLDDVREMVRDTDADIVVFVEATPASSASYNRLARSIPIGLIASVRGVVTSRSLRERGCRRPPSRRLLIPIARPWCRSKPKLPVAG